MRGKPYSELELLVLLDLMRKYGKITYFYPRNLAGEFYERTGVERSHGSLYMASWRLLNGYYAVHVAA